jgi:hypothetical protein
MANVEHDLYPEITDNEQGTRRLELLGIKEHLRNPDERRALYADMTDEQYAQMFGYVNSIMRGKRIEYDYENGETPFMSTPSLEDKEPLMDLAFETVRSILSDPDLDDKMALRRAGIAMAGAINYIHPKDNGNGRSGRVMHYMIEFGTERGDQAFNEEMYAIIAKLPVYDTDKKVALYDTPPPELERALEKEVERRYPESYADMSPSEIASTRVAVFLDMMRGAVRVPIHEAGTAASQDGISLYEQQYVALSAIANRSPGDVPENAQRVLAEKTDANARTFTIDLDIM